MNPLPSPISIRRVALAVGLVLSLAGLSCETTPTSTAPEPACASVPGALDFGSVALGNAVTRSATLRNETAGPVTGTVSMESPGEDLPGTAGGEASFQLIAGGGDYTLEPGAERVLTVRFAPGSRGEHSSRVLTGSACADVSLTGSGSAGPECVLEPASLDFGLVTPGSSAEGVIVLSNRGGGVLTGSVVLPDSCDVFSLVSGGGAYSLGTGESRTIRIRYSPLGAGAAVCELVTGSGACPTAGLSGSAATPAGCGVTPGALDFGTVPLGNNADRTFSITNVGGSVLTGTVGSPCPEFHVLAGGGAYSLAPGRSHTVSVRFTPSRSGSHGCQLDVGSACVPVAMTGIGSEPPVCVVEPGQLNFPPVAVGSSRDISVTLTNGGGGTLTGSVAASCGPFSVVAGGGSYSLGAGASRVITLRFAPTQPGDAACDLDLGGACQDLPMTGRGTAAETCTLNPSNLDFGEITVGESAERTFTLTHSGSGTLTGSIAVSCDAFSIVSGGGDYSLASGASRVVTVRFSPTVAGARSCTIDTGTGCRNVTAFGTGIQVGGCSVSPTAINFGLVSVDSSATRSFTLTNTGASPVSGVVQENCDAVSLSSGGGAYTLASGASRSVAVVFAPNQSGDVTCLIDTGLPCANVTVRGSGALEAGCRIAPIRLDYGSLTVGETRDLGFTLFNDGVEVLSGVIAADCDAFTVVSGGGSYSLAPGLEREVTVRFSPTSAGSFDCQITAGPDCDPVPVTGSGELPPTCGVEPASIDFGSVRLGSSRQRTTTVTNVGGGVLTGTVSLECDGFRIVSGGGDYALGAGESVTVTLAFEPDAEGVAACELLTGTDCSAVSLQGTGTAATACTVDPLDLEFGVVEVGESRDLEFSLTNTGGGNLTGTVSLDCEDYSLVGGGGDYDLGSGESRTVTVRFTPTTEGASVCTVQTGAQCEEVAMTGTGSEAPVCLVSPSTLDFGSVTLGQSKDLSLTLANTGGGFLEGTITESCPDFAVVSGGGDFSIAGGSSMTISVRFTPGSPGAASCQLLTGSSCGEISLIGSGESLPVCGVEPATLDFGTLPVGSSKDLTVTLTNDGGGVLSGSVSEACAPFAIVSGGGSYSLSAGQSRSVTVRYTPTAPGQNDCTLATGGACAEVPMTGAGEALAACSVDETSLDFGDVTIGSNSSQSFTITNTGGGTLTGIVSEACPEVTLTAGGGAYSLGAGASRTVTVRLAPTTQGPVACVISLGTPGCPEVTVTGNGQLPPGCAVVPPSLDFDQVILGTTKDLTVDIINNGGGTIAGTVSLSSCDAGYTVVNGGGAYSLGANQQRQVTVRFNPGSAGIKECTLETGSPLCADVEITGVGEPAPVCSISPTALDFGVVTTGTTKDLSFTITNTGGSLLQGSVSEPCGEFSLVAGAGDFSLAAGEMVSVTVRFAPLTAGAKGCDIALGTECNLVAASGIGELPPACAVTPSSIDLGTVTTGTTRDTTFVVRNVGGGVLTGTVSESCPGYRVLVGSGPFALAATESLEVTVRFAPVTDGVQDCTVETGTNCLDVDLTALADPPPACEVVPASLDFGTVTTGTFAERLLVIRNTGGGVLVGDVSESCPEFTLESGGGAFALAADESVTVTVRLSPLTDGAKACTIETGTECADVPASGTAELPPACLVFPGSIDFGVVEVGSFSDTTVIIANTGGGTVTGTVAETCADFTVESGLGAFSLASNETLQVVIRYAPSGSGASAACDIETGTECADVAVSGVGELPPSCTVTPASIDFGTVTVGADSDTTFTIRNDGEGTLTGSVSESCADFAVIAGGGAFALGANDSVVVTVRYTPSGSGASAACDIETGTECADVAVSGVGELPPSCTVTPASIDFGTVTVGADSDTTFTIRNDGEGTLTGSVSESCADFAVIAGGGAFALGANDSVVVTVRYTPSGSGASAACDIETGTECADVAVSGVGELPPSCTVTPASIDFGTVTVGADSDTTFTIRNDGEGTLTGSVSESCADFSIIAGGGAFALGANDSVVVTVRYTPSGSGASAACDIETGTECADVAVSGVGELPPSCTVTPASIDFGTVTVGASLDTTFTIRNDGEGTLTGSVSESCADFAVIAGGGAFALGANDSVVVTVRYTPSGSGASAACDIETGTECADVAVSGVGELPPSCTVTPASIDFGTVTVGADSDTTFTIRNDGEGTLTGSVSESCADFAVIAGGGAFALGANDSVVVTVRYTPSGSGASAACDIETGTECADVAVSGVGELPPSCTVTPASIDFGTVTVGADSDTTFTIRNDGEGTLTGSVSETCADFAILAGGGAFALAANDSVVVTVRFTPAGVGPAPACSIETGTECADVPVSGSGS